MAEQAVEQTRQAEEQAVDRPDNRIALRLGERDLRLVRLVARYRYLQKRNGMAKNNLSEYVRSLISRDIEQALQSIRERRRTD